MNAKLLSTEEHNRTKQKLSEKSKFALKPY